ncbi:MAG TPA: M28 family peptidase [Candidatus Gemmiger avium]|nr:M28 family peptidase [Candidatus Gemmiger avium]
MSTKKKGHAILLGRTEETSTWEAILRATQPELKTCLHRWLEQNGFTPVSRDGYLYAAGGVPVLLVAHLDTVHREPVRDICYNADRTVAMSPQGIGGDDRAGVWMALHILEQVRCHVVFCEDEEIGCVGARKFSRRAQLPQVNYIVEMDRRGANDAVFYRCDNPVFTEYVCGFGLEVAYGSCSDISYIAPSIGAAAVNISCGYYCEHQRYEYIRLDQMRRNAQRIAEMVAAPSPRFEYREPEEWIPGRWFDAPPVWWRQKRMLHRENLMQLPEDANVLLHGRELAKDRFLIDRDGNVYRYLPDLQAAIVLEQARAQDAAGMPYPFRPANSHPCRVLSVEEAIERLQTMA